MTSQGQDNYRQYLREMGFCKNPSHGRLVFIDLIGGGGGIKYLIHQARYFYQQESVLLPEILVVNFVEFDKDFNVDDLGVKKLSLGLERLGKALDRVSNNIRVMPDFPAWRWHEWKTDPKQFPCTDGGSKIVELIRTTFSHEWK